jgi:phosphatidate phosphatase APP1
MLRVLRALAARFKRWKRRLKQRLGLFDPLQILPFRGHGTPARLLVSGRVLEREGVIDDTTQAVQAPRNPFARLRASLRRLRSDEIPDARLELRFGDVVREAVTDAEGYFRVEVEAAAPVAPGWHEVEIVLLASMAGSEGTRARARVLVPGDDADFAVISDIDDTVVVTGAASKLRMVWSVLFHDARSREPFPGVAQLYRALQRGRNPIFYVSRSGWNLYDLFDAFMRVHGLPRGPMFLTDLALVEPKSRAMGGGEDKLGRIRALLSTYPALRFVLIGDSGQEDPEIYRRIVAEHPGRIRAVYIRDVSGRRRDAEVRAIVEELRRAGVAAAAVATSVEAARHAAAEGLVEPGTVEEVAAAAQRATTRPRQVTGRRASAAMAAPSDTATKTATASG